MVEESDLKQWRDAGHVARRTLEGIKGEIVAGKGWNEVIDSAERFIRRHGGQAAFPVTISVNDFAAHYTTNTQLSPPEGWEREMVFEKGDLVKLDVGVHIKGALGDNAMTLEVGNGGNHTDQIKVMREARDAAIEKMHPGTPWHVVGRQWSRFLRTTDSCRSRIYAGTKWRDGVFMMEFQSPCTPVAQITQVSRVQ